MLNAVRAWILLSALLVAAGWMLSAFHQLNGLGYGAALALAAFAFWFWRRRTKWRPEKNPAQAFHRFRRRFRRAAPLIFLALALLTLLAGALYAPSNGSSTAYRIPRAMHWLAAGQWHWIRTLDVRMNSAGNGLEWLFAPLILLTRSDRLLFLLNWLPFLLLPGLIFSVFTRLGVRRRVAWWWMWLLPSGWIFIFQAASTLNDAFGTAYALAALDFGLRARENKNIGSVWLALLAAALATDVKQTCILLALPALIVIWPSARLLLKRPLASLAVAAACLLVSAAPMIFFNWQHTGSWDGITTKSWEEVELNSPFWAVIGNAFCLTVQNFKPPVFPFNNSWNAAMHHFLQTPSGAHFRQFEAFGRLSFGVEESTASFGAGICFLILISFFAARHYRRISGTVAGGKSGTRNPEPGMGVPRLLRWTPWALLLVFMAKVGAFENGRYLAPYYILLCPSLLTGPGHSVLVRRHWWQGLALFVLAAAAALVFISRDRPLFPSQTILGWLTAKYPDSTFVSHVASTYAETPAFEAERRYFRNNLPPDATVLGYAAISRENESLLWLPYGRRRVEVILPGDTTEQLRSAGIKYAVISQEKFLNKTNETIRQWLARHHGILIKQCKFLEDPYEPPEDYYLVELPGS